MANDKLAVLQAEETVKELNQVVGAVDIVTNSFTDLLGITKKLNNSLSSGKPKEYAEATKKLNEVKGKVVKTAEKERLAEIKLQQAREKAFDNFEKQVKIQGKSNASREKARIRLKAQNDAYGKLNKTQAESARRSQRLGAILIELDNRGQTNTKRFKELSNAYLQATMKAKGLDSQLKKLDKSVGKSQRNVGNYASAINGLTNVAGALGVIGVADTFIRLGEKAFDVTRELDSMNNSMLAVFETQEEVAKQNIFLSKIAEDYGLEIINLTGSYKSFSAAVKGTNLEGEKSQKIFDTVTKTSAQLGLTTEQTKGALLALEQMVSKGTVSAEELRGQLGERIPGAFRIFADALGVNTQKLGEMLQAGEILAEDALPKFAVALEQAYNLDTIDRVDTLVASQNRLSNDFTNLVDNFEKGTGVISGTAIAFNTMGSSILGFLNNLLPVNNEITKSKDELNKLALQLKLNVDNEEEFNRVLGEINDKYPSFLQGLTEEAIKRGEINKNLMIANEQYVKQLVLQEKQEELDDILEHRAGLYRTLTEMVSDNSKEFLKFNNEQVKVFNTFLSGNSTLEETIDKLEEHGEVTGTQRILLSQMTLFLDKNTGSLAKLDKEYKNTNLEMKGQNDLLNKMIGLNGDLTSSQSFLNNSMDKFNDTIEFGNRLLASRIAIAKGDFVGALVALAPSEEVSPSQNTTSSSTNTTTPNVRRSSNRSNSDAEKAQREAQGGAEKALRIEQQKEAELIKIQSVAANLKLENKKGYEAEKARIELEFNDKIAEARRKMVVGDDLNKLSSKAKANQEKINNELLSTIESYEKIKQFKITQAASKAIQEDQARQQKAYNRRLIKLQTHNQNELNEITSFEEAKKFLSEDELEGVVNLEQAKEVIKEKHRSDELTLQKEHLETLQTQLQDILEKGDFKGDQKQALLDDLDELGLKIAKVNGEGAVDIEGDEQIKKAEQLLNIRDSIADAFANMGLDELANQFASFFDSIVDQSNQAAQDIAAGLSAGLAVAGSLLESQSKSRIESINAENEAFQESTDLKISDIDKQLEAENLSAEEIEQLENQKETFEAQKRQRDSQTKRQQYIAEQNASANQALINGALGATKTIAKLGVPFGLPSAAISLAFGLAQSTLIRSKPIPEFYTGTSNAPEGYAWTQERGAEIIVDKKGNIKTMGTNKGREMTYLEKGDKVYTASQSKNMVKDMIFDNDMLTSMALNGLSTPNITHIEQKGLDEGQMRSIMDGVKKTIKDYATTTIHEQNGRVFTKKGNGYWKESAVLKPSNYSSDTGYFTKGWTYNIS